jgi:hypothetical protein
MVDVPLPLVSDVQHNRGALTGTRSQRHRSRLRAPQYSLAPTEVAVVSERSAEWYARASRASQSYVDPLAHFVWCSRILACVTTVPRGACCGERDSIDCRWTRSVTSASVQGALASDSQPAMADVGTDITTAQSIVEASNTTGCTASLHRF